MNACNQCSQQSCVNCVSNMKFAGHNLCFNNKSEMFMHDVNKYITELTNMYCKNFKNKMDV